VESGRTKRSLRVVKWLEMTAMKRVADAQESLKVQFASHKCNAEDASRAAVEAVNRATRD
jgi:hypothetical protein